MDDVQKLLDSDFMKAPSQTVLDDITVKFLEATSNASLKVASCASCARETEVKKLEDHLLSDIPNLQNLQPVEPHQAHELTQGYLLFMPAVTINQGVRVSVCGECLSALKKDRRPKLSLANNMWVGDIPPQLRNLTLPERMLIAKFYPSAYIVKLYPKHESARSWDSSQMHNGLRGNVATYRLDPNLVASMIDGRMFPPSPRILSATIGVTFIGPKGKIPEKSMPHMFRVRRWRVHEALLWLKANNPLYQDIEISQERLDALPENGIPEEIMSNARHSDDIETVREEHAGYVPIDAMEEAQGQSLTHCCEVISADLPPE